MKKFAVQIVFLIIVIGVSLFFFNPAGPTSSINIPFFPQKPALKELEINNIKLKVEIADTQTKRNKGLGGRESIATDEGMLFVFDKTDKYVFWMKGLKFPLDFIWILDDKVVDVLLNVSPPTAGQSDVSLPVYSAREPINKVLEVNGGTAERLNIKVGDLIKIN